MMRTIYKVYFRVALFAARYLAFFFFFSARKASSPDNNFQCTFAHSRVQTRRYDYN